MIAIHLTHTPVIVKTGKDEATYCECGVGLAIEYNGRVLVDPYLERTGRLKTTEGDESRLSALLKSGYLKAGEEVSSGG